MDILILIIGIVLLSIVITDFFHTALSFQGSGPVTRTVYRYSWAFYATITGKNQNILRYGGTFLAIVMLATWALLLWLGLFLVFQSDADSVIKNDVTEAASSAWDKLYYTGFVLSTMGLGDFRPGTIWAQIVTAIFSFSGFIFFTLSLSYLLSLSNAVVQKRTLATTINNMGDSPQQILLNGWNGTDFHLLKDHLSDLKQMVNSLIQSHRAFPILHYFTTADRISSISIALVKLDDALMIFLHLLQTKGIGPMREAEQMRKAIDNYIDMVLKEMWTEDGDAWPAPATEELEEKGFVILPLDDDKTTTFQERRRVLHGYLSFEGWKVKDL